MPAPTVTAVAPAVGTLLGGTSVVVTGTNFTVATGGSPVSAVAFGTTNAVSFSVQSATQLTVTAPPHVAGTVDITVTNAAGTSATGAPDQFTYQPTVAVQVPGSPGAVITYQAANALGDTFFNDGRTEFRCKNGSVGAITLTILGKQNCSQGFLHNSVITVAAGAEEVAGALSTAQFTDPATGFVNVTYSAVTTITVAAVRIS